MRAAPLVLLAVTLPSLALATACAGKAGAPEQTPSATEDNRPIPTLSGELENVYVIAEGDVILNGHMYGAEHDTLVILAHMRPNDKTAWLPFAQELGDRGYAALAFDFRGYGDSTGDQDFGKLDEDLRQVITQLRGPPYNKQKIFLVGASMGGTTSLVVASQEDVAGVVAVSAPAQFEDQDALSVVGQITEPKLFIASEGVEADMVYLDELFQAAAAPKERQTYPGDAHGTDLLDSENGAAFKQRIFQFLQERSQ